MKPGTLLSPAVLLILLAVVLLHPQPAMAYVGPGAGLSALGALLAIVVGVVVALFGFVWYPIRRLRKKWKGGDSA
jgi:hypothetical protein